ncbi:AAA family ATPase [Natroniella sulfidigena]|uniref:Lon protease family protein n=1 Tax=Natroniella sulfidigena TaxID=723921 RepID=UPI00200A7424|nr:AAA family ATPase [Natroniella sulfidigena]MCK8817430.1 AAA family ATPase [Natroniella sulfidigena]
MEGQKISREKLRRECSLEQFDFETTQDLEPSFEIIGQQQALEAIEFGLNVEQDDYNIFVVSSKGRDKIKFIIEQIKKQARQETEPDDWCYLYNFNDPQQPVACNLPAGMGQQFKEELKIAVDNMEQAIKENLFNEEFMKKRSELENKHQQEVGQLLAQLESQAEELGFILEKQESGFAIIPLLDDGSPMEEERYDNLPPEEKEKLDQEIEHVQEKLNQGLQKLSRLIEKYQQESKKLNQRVNFQIINSFLQPLFEKYEAYDKIISYLKELRKDIIKSLGQVQEVSEEEVGLFKEVEEKSWSANLKYGVNLLVDNSELDGAPVVFVEEPTYYKLLGRIEYETKGNSLVTNFKKIKVGGLHQANGGYLVLEAEELLTNFQSWKLIKQVLKTGSLQMKNLGEEYDKVPLSSLEPERIPLDIKVILIGSHRIYQLLYNYDNDFSQLFKIKSVLQSEVDWTVENNYKLARYISYRCQKDSLRPLNKGAVGRVIEYAAQLTGNQQKLTTNFEQLSSLLYEADTWANLEGEKLITKEGVEQTLRQKKYRVNHYQKQIEEMYHKEKILLQTKGVEVGQINGLSIIDLGDYSFGKPTRITAAVYQGNRGVINIERETKLSGKIHNKGLMVLTAYLGQKYAQRNRLSLSASLCFEQLYSGIDGDSASSTELYALLSALSEVPIKQSLAVTGSINQKGKIQPVGGITKKIEGFFRICKLKGLTGEQGVLIPTQNIEDLMLADEVVEAVKDEQFHIYAISDVEEGLEILTGVEAGNKNEAGGYPQGTINYLVQTKLDQWAK